MKMIEVDVVITHPKGITDKMKDTIVDSITKAVAKHGAGVGGSFELVDEPQETENVETQKHPN